MALDYKKAGVDIEAGYKSVELIKGYVKETMRPEVLGGLGGFSGAFSLSKIKDMEDPVLVSGTDGCGSFIGNLRGFPRRWNCRNVTAVLRLRGNPPGLLTIKTRN